MTEQKRADSMSPEQVQAGSRSWWSSNPMDYDWQSELRLQRLSPEWFDAIDQRFIHGSRLFATGESPFDRIIPLDYLPDKRVLEIGCGMGLHTEVMTRAGAKVTAIDLTPIGVEATTRRLEIKGLRATVIMADAEKLPFTDGSFDFVWSWGVIHHSARTARVVREISRVLAPNGACRVMVYNREGAPARIAMVWNYILRGAFLRQSYEETLFQNTDGFSARYYVREQFEDLFRAYFRDVSSEILGQEADVIPLPRRSRELLLRVVPQAYLERAQARYGGFIFLRAANKE